MVDYMVAEVVEELVVVIFQQGILEAQEEQVKLGLPQGQYKVAEAQEEPHLRRQEPTEKPAFLLQVVRGEHQTVVTA
jgi:hypothetical protein